MNGLTLSGRGTALCLVGVLLSLFVVFFGERRHPTV